jgi:hypothetical protein
MYMYMEICVYIYLYMYICIYTYTHAIRRSNIYIETQYVDLDLKEAGTYTLIYMEIIHVSICVYVKADHPCLHT